MRATGIGCFFDDAVHRLLGLDGLTWQSLYHFTVGGPVEDRRVQTLPPYAHRRRGHSQGISANLSPTIQILLTPRA